MLTALEARSSQGATLILPLADTSGGFLVKDIEGLDPVKATIVYSTFARMPGAQFQSSRRESRNIVLSLDPRPNATYPSVKALRNRLYGYFMPEADVHLSFIDSEIGRVEIDGKVEDFDFPLFTKEPSAKISILCLLPDFIKMEEEIVEGDTVADETTQTIDYDGTIETGFVFRLLVDRSIGEFTIHSTAADNASRSLNFVGALVDGDVLEISTVPGNKYANLYRSGGMSSILYGVDPGSAWIELFPGENDFRVQALGAAIPYTLEYTTKYGGL